MTHNSRTKGQSMLAEELDSVVIVDYDPERKNLFNLEKELLSDLFAGINITIEHVGSTSIEGLGGKPIIDIMIGVESLDVVDERIEQLAAHHYLYLPHFEQDFPERKFFRKPKTGPRECHLHCALIDSDFYRDHIDFRNYLMNNPSAADEYFELKQRLADQHGHDRNAYTNAKSDFIERSLELARQKNNIN
ncbi:MAG: GrpB family protein [Gammaproteobacteria bacterium]